MCRPTDMSSLSALVRPLKPRWLSGPLNPVVMCGPWIHCYVCSGPCLVAGPLGLTCSAVFCKFPTWFNKNSKLPRKKKTNELSGHEKTPHETHIERQLYYFLRVSEGQKNLCLGKKEKKK